MAIALFQQKLMLWFKRFTISFFLLLCFFTCMTYYINSVSVTLVSLSPVYTVVHFT